MTQQSFAGRRFQFNSAALKYIAAATMLIDHIACGFLEVGRGADGRSLMFSIRYGVQLDEIGRMIGRTAFPIFLFFAVEGYLHTRNRVRYVMHMLVFGALSHFPFRWLFFPRSKSPHTGTMITLALGVIAIWGIDWLSEQLRTGRNILPMRRPHKSQGRLENPKKTADFGEQGIETVVQEAEAAKQEEKKISPDLLTKIGRAALLILGGTAWTALCSLIARQAGSDYTYGGVIAVVILFVLYRYREWSFLAAWAWLSYYNAHEQMAVLGFALLLCYNGKRGKQNKYFFYLFYPLHLFLLALLRQLLPFVS